MPLPSEWTLAETKALRHLSTDEAEELMDRYGLGSEARAALQQFISIDVQQPMNRVSKQAAVVATTSIRNGRQWSPPDPDRPLWLAAAWLLGASYSTLARLHSITPQAVQQSVSKSMPDAQERHTRRLGYRVGFERMEAFHIAYLDHVHELRGMGPEACARWLLSHTETESDPLADL